jgi:hypothetical protein
MEKWLQPQWIVAACALLGLVLNIGGLIFGYWTLTTGQKLIQVAQDAIWSEIIAIKQALGLANGGPGKYVTREKIESIEQWEKDTKLRLDSHSERIRELEMTVAKGQ